MKKKLRLVRSAKRLLAALGISWSLYTTGFPLNAVYLIDNALNQDGWVEHNNTQNSLLNDAELNRFVDMLEFSFFPTYFYEDLPVGQSLSEWAQTVFNVFEAQVKEYEKGNLTPHQRAWYDARLNSARYFATNHKLVNIIIDEVLCDEKIKQSAIAISDGKGNAVIAFHGLAGSDTLDDYNMFKSVNFKQTAGYEFIKSIIDNYDRVTLTWFSGGGAVAQYVMMKMPEKVYNVVCFNPKGQTWIYMVKNAEDIRKWGRKVRNIAQEEDFVHILLPQIGNVEIIQTNYPNKNFSDVVSGTFLGYQHLVTSMLDRNAGYNAIMPGAKGDNPLVKGTVHTTKIAPGAASTLWLLKNMRRRKKDNEKCHNNYKPEHHKKGIKKFHK